MRRKVLETSKSSCNASVRQTKRKAAFKADPFYCSVVYRKANERAQTETTQDTQTTDSVPLRLIRCEQLGHVCVGGLLGIETLLAWLPGLASPWFCARHYSFHGLVCEGRAQACV